MIEYLVQSPSPSPSGTPIDFTDTTTFTVILEIVKIALPAILGVLGTLYITRGQRKAQSKDDREAREYQAELDRIAREEEHRHKAEEERRRREEEREERELDAWKELIDGLRAVLRLAFSQLDDPEKMRLAREQWDNDLERRLTTLAPFTKNERARKIAFGIRIEFHRLRGDSFYFENNDHTDARWEEKHKRFDIAWNEALFLIAKLTNAIGGELPESRTNWPGNLRHDDDEKDERDFGDAQESREEPS